MKKVGIQQKHTALSQQMIQEEELLLTFHMGLIS